MCMICIDIAKNKLMPFEAIRNLSEIADNLDDDHFDDVLRLIDEVIRKQRDEFDIGDLS
jgi:hypothetical protein